MVFSLAHKYVNNYHDAEEITQDVFVKIHTALGEFENRSSLKTWIFRITINASLEHIKKSKRKKRFGFLIPLFHEESGEENTGKHQETDPHSDLESREAMAELSKLIAGLPEKQRTALLLSKLKDMSYKEIAEVMETTESAVDSLLSRAKANLKKDLEKIFPDRRK